MNAGLSALLKASVTLVGEDLDDLMSRVEHEALSRDERILLLVRALKSTDPDRAVAVGAMAVNRLVEAKQEAAK